MWLYRNSILRLFTNLHITHLATHKDMNHTKSHRGNLETTIKQHDTLLLTPHTFLIYTKDSLRRDRTFNCNGMFPSSLVCPNKLQGA